jgi:AraC-like DNA-binding protein
VFQPGFKYSKAEVLLLSLCQKGEYTDDLFSISQSVATEKVMGVLDSINERWGRGTLRLASVPTDPDWGMRREIVLGTAIEFSQEFNAIVCRRRDLDMPIPAADPALHREIKRSLDMQLTTQRDKPAQRVRQIVKMLLPSGLCSVDGIAQHLGMHRRTLSRHLAVEGESVTKIINAVRAELAEEYLANSKRRLYEVAELLGFSSAGDFSRWFRSQFGKTPSDWAAAYRESKATLPL